LRGLDPFTFELAGREVARPLALPQAPSRGSAEGRDEIFADYHLRVGQITSRGDVLQPRVNVGVLVRERARADAVDDYLVPSEASDAL
jgi:hypothetical protein